MSNKMGKESVIEAMIDYDVGGFAYTKLSYGTMEGVYINGVPLGIIFHETDNDFNLRKTIVNQDAQLKAKIAEQAIDKATDKK